MDKSPERIWADTGLYYNYTQDWSEGSWGIHEDCGPVEYIRKDVSDAMVAAAYKNIAEVFSNHDVIRRDDYPEWFINRWETFLENTPADAQAALEHMVQKARKEGEKQGIQKAANLCDTTKYYDFREKGAISSLRDEILSLIEE